MSGSARRILNTAEQKYRTWWRNATPLERIELEIKLMEYDIKEAELKRLGRKVPKKSYAFLVRNMETRWRKDGDSGVGNPPD